MKQTIKSLFLMLLCIGMCSVTASAVQADVVSETPTVGESYYLYNIGTGKFFSAYKYKNLNPSLASYGLKLTIGSATDGGYTIIVESIQKMLYASSTSYAEIDVLGGDETRYSWNFIRQEDGYYRIQCAQDNKNYDANNYLGWKDNKEGQVKFEQTGSLDWAFLTEEAYKSIAYQMPTQQHDFPTLPASKLESGSTYYLYNVDARGFLGTSGSSIFIHENPEPVQIELLDNDSYCMRLTNEDSWYVGFDGIKCTEKYNYKTKWKIDNVGDDTYMIQRSPFYTYDYNAVEYMGWQGEYTTNYVIVNQPQDYGAKWKLIPADEMGDRFAAELKLYYALAKSEAYSGREWNINNFTGLYDAREASSPEEIMEAAYSLRNGLGMSAGYIAPYWNERPIFWYAPDGNFGEGPSYAWSFNEPYSTKDKTTGTSFIRSINASKTTTLSATIDVEEASKLVYELGGNNSGSKTLKVYIDGVLVRDLNSAKQYVESYTRFFEDLTSGVHTIKWVYSGDDVRVKNVGVMACPLISVNLLEPGSLGTEVLYNTDHIKNVRRLKVKGKWNDDDWKTIKMMHYLSELDLSETGIKEIPKNQFSCISDTSSNFLHKIILPEGLEKIRSRAFYYSHLDTLKIPSTLVSVEEESFYRSQIQQLDLPDNLTTFGSGSAFSYMYWLKELTCPKNLKTISEYSFSGCENLEETVLPDSLVTIGERAFENCYKMKIKVFPENLRTISERAFYFCHALNPQFNSKLDFIGEYAFYGNRSIKSLSLPESVSTLEKAAFSQCMNLENVTISSPIWKLSDDVFEGCPKLNTLRLNSPTVVGHTSTASDYPVPTGQIANVKLIVPEHLVAQYKLEPYWYNFKSIEGFSTDEMQSWRINNPLVLNRERLLGNPDIAIAGNHDRLPSLKINGENAQEINNLHFWGYTWSNDSYAGQLLSNCDNVKINGDVMTDLETGDKRWHFFCLPYDVKVSDITPLDQTAQMAVRYYDGANRAANGVAGSWKNYEAEDIIPAGTGFIMQTNKRVSNRFTSFNDTKQNVVANVEFVKTLEVNASETASNRGWNLVGNPWQCFYNDHALNFTAPITVWNTGNRTYTAYSITDDDYAIRPNEAFFVQCPNEENNTIGFPTQGRQLDAIIKSQNAVKGKASKAGTRKLIDLVISNGDTEDRTRVVLNDEADINYDITCDAGKMMSMDSNVPQIYTLGEDNVQYAINERPMGEGLVTLGYYAGRSGKLTIKLDRCRAEKVYLIDYETNETTDLTSGSYTFTTESGVNDVRFKLAFEGDDKTGITVVEKAGQAAPKVYTVDGKYVGNSIEGLKSGVYVINQSGKSHKMLVK